MIRVRVHVSRWSWIEVSSGGREVRFALADRVQVYAVQTRFQPRGLDGNLYDGRRAVLHFFEVGGAGDPVTLDIRVRIAQDDPARPLHRRLRSRDAGRWRLLRRG